MTALPKKITLTNINLTLIAREGNAAVFEKRHNSFPDSPPHYVAFLIYRHRCADGSIAEKPASGSNSNHCFHFVSSEKEKALVKMRELSGVKPVEVMEESGESGGFVGYAGKAKEETQILRVQPSQKRGRKKINLNIKIPTGKFTTKQLAKDFPSVSPTCVYLRIQEMVKSGAVKVAGKEENRVGRGKPQIYYCAA